MGIYGDADPLDITQWSQIGFSVPSPARSWNAKTSTCKSMFTGLNLEFLVAASGERSNPQNKIIAARAEVVTQDWVMKLVRSLYHATLNVFIMMYFLFFYSVPSGDDTTKQVFPLAVTVSFVFKQDNVVRGYEPPAPPVLFEVPYDVFYPFLQAQKSKGTASSVASGVMSVSMVVACASLLWTIW